jgi:hypothetical protein
LEKSPIPYSTGPLQPLRFFMSIMALMQSRNIFLNAPFRLRLVTPPPPPLWHPLFRDHSREGNSTPSQSAGAVSGGGTGTVPSDTRDSQFVEILGFPMKNAQSQYYRDVPPPASAMTCTAPKRDAPAAFQLPKNSDPGLLKIQLPIHSYLHNFSWWGEIHSCSRPFQQSRHYL